MTAEDAEDRRRSRSSWPVRVRRLADAGEEDLSATTTPEERLAMMWPLALDAWALSGRPLLSIPRAELPIVVRRLPPGRHRPGA